MLNVEMIEHLYAQLTEDRKEDLRCRLFGRSTTGIDYFRRHSDISLEKLETLSDFFHIPMECFRTGTHYPMPPRDCSNNIVGTVDLPEAVLFERAKLDREKAEMKAKLLEKDAEILALKIQIEKLMASFRV